MTIPKEQRLEAWMGEVTSLLCYQPDIPQDHKTVLVNAFKLFEKEGEHPAVNSIITLRGIKAFALTTKLDGPAALAHIVRMCIDAGIRD